MIFLDNKIKQLLERKGKKEGEGDIFSFQFMVPCDESSRILFPCKKT